MQNYIFSLLPSLLFIICFYYLDSFKLISKKIIGLLFLSGLISAFLSLYINDGFNLYIQKFELISLYFAPIVEETLKSLILVYFFQKKRFGFLTDSALAGFIVGLGFASFENVWYLHTFALDNPLLWIIRGCGSALLHAGSTSLFSLLFYYFSEKEKSKMVYLYSIVPSILLHFFFNLPLFPIIPKVVLQLVLIPSLLYFIYVLSEKKLYHWMEKDFDVDHSILRMIRSDQFSQTELGKYLASLSANFPPLVRVDMFCYIQLSIELSFYAKGLLLMQEMDLEIEIDTEQLEKIRELEELKKVIGKSGLLVLKPILPNFDKKIWQILWIKSK